MSRRGKQEVSSAEFGVRNAECPGTSQIGHHQSTIINQLSLAAPVFHASQVRNDQVGQVRIVQQDSYGLLQAGWPALLAAQRPVPPGIQGDKPTLPRGLPG